MRTLRLLASIPAVLLSIAACGPIVDPNVPSRSAVADKWQTRAKASFRAGDFEDAAQATDSGMKESPKDPEILTLAARVALARLEYAKAIKLTEGLQTTDAHAVRGRAYWYQGDVEQAAEELEAMLRDPQVKDPWARDVAKLARRGQGRHPFAIENAMVAAVEMPAAGPALIVPFELEGEQVLGMVSTSVGELVIDSASRKEPAWVNLRFGPQLEVKDVPAFTQDLSGISHQLGAPIKAMLGVNLLRHMHVTFDRRGSQFVVRKQEPSAPPDASRVPLYYVRGGGMIVRATLATKDEGFFPMLIDSSAMFPLAVDDSLFRKAGIDPTKLQAAPSLPNVRTGTLPNLRIGSFDMPQVPAMQAKDLPELRTQLDLDLAGVVGSSLLSVFRVTFGDEGRFMWIEPDIGMTEPQGPPPGAEDPRSAPPPPPLVPDSPKPGKNPEKKPDPKAAPKPAAAPAKPAAPVKPAAPAAAPPAKKP
jgi:hypothetical protein